MAPGYPRFWPAKLGGPILAAEELIVCGEVTVQGLKQDELVLKWPYV